MQALLAELDQAALRVCRACTSETVRGPMPGRIYHPTWVAWLHGYRRREAAGEPLIPSPRDVPESIPCTACEGAGVVIDPNTLEARAAAAIRALTTNPAAPGDTGAPR